MKYFNNNLSKVISMRTVKQLFPLGKALLLALLAVFAFAACSDDPSNPQNEIEKKEHGDPVKARLVLTKGHMHGQYDFHAEADSQVIVFSTTSTTGWAAEDLDSFVVEAGIPEGEDDSVAYALNIYYYDINGNLINDQFVTNGQDKIHQHFFVADDVTPNEESLTYLYNENTRKLYDYTYADTDPTDATKIIGSTNPIGFKGYFRFNTAEKKFNLGINLMHSISSKYAADGSTSPYYRPSAQQRQVDHWDLKINIPVTIESATEHHHHDEESEPVKAVLMLAEGHLHGTYGFHQNPDIDNMVYLKKVQTITLTKASGSWQIAEGSPTQFNVRSGRPGTAATDGNIVYGLWIYYYNDEDSLINGGFIDNGADSLHQHFFIPSEVVPTFDGTADTDDSNVATLYDYVYCDTDPWNKTVHYDKATITGKNNPVGFKGYFRFNKPRKQFNMNIRLMHAAASKFVNGTASPYYAPTSQQLQVNHWEVNLSVPFVIYATQSEYLTTDEELDITWDDLTAGDQVYITSIAKAYGLTWQQVFTDLYWLINGKSDPESGSLWF